ncbi:MAG: hypothetical protein MI744_10075 [Pseudomonadales bacterium]|nr:hypothetical protein [Pseudomonadales bacterium]
MGFFSGLFGGGGGKKQSTATTSTTQAAEQKQTFIGSRGNSVMDFGAIQGGVTVNNSGTPVEVVTTLVEGTGKAFEALNKSNNDQDKAIAVIAASTTASQTSFDKTINKLITPIMVIISLFTLLSFRKKK